jgi:hypothetical protein
MPTSTYEKIATYTVPSATPSYTFSTIPATYTDIVLVSSFQAAANGDSAVLQFNGTAGTAYSWTQFIGNGTAASSSRRANTDAARFANDVPSSNFNTSITQIQNYSNTTTYKTLLSRSNTAAISTIALVALWSNTAAINSIKIFCESGNINTGSTFTLYGIKAA